MPEITSRLARDGELHIRASHSCSRTKRPMCDGKQDERRRRVVPSMAVRAETRECEVLKLPVCQSVIFYKHKQHCSKMNRAVTEPRNSVARSVSRHG